MILSYTVTVRGPLPPDLGYKVASAHAAALKAAPRKCLKGKRSQTPYPRQWAKGE